MSEVPVIPQYPGALPLNGQASPTIAHGGGMLQNWATDDAPETVVAFFAERLGAGAPAPGAPWPAAWHLSAPDGSEHHVEVWPADGAYPFRDDVAAPPPPTARTVVHETSYIRPHGEPLAAPVSESTSEPAVDAVSTRWTPPPLAWLLALVAIGLVIAWLRR